MWPMVPTLTCGLLRSNFSLAMSVILALRVWSRCPGSNWRPRPYQGRALPTELHRLSQFMCTFGSLERETGIEPATNSLEGCDSTTELLPQIFIPHPGAIASGGEGRTRTFEAARATDLQSAAFDRFATSPIVCNECCFERSPQNGCSRWSWRRDSNPRPADYKSAALPA